MTEKEYADNDTPYAGRYIEYITEEDVCVCSHTNELHNDQYTTQSTVQTCRKCSKCECKEFELDDGYYGDCN